MIDWIILIIILLFFGILAFLSLKSNINSVSNRNFAYLIITGGFWILFNFLENEIHDLFIARNFLTLDFIFAALMVYFFLIFALYFTDSKLIVYKSIFIIYTLFVILSVFLNFVIVNIRFENQTIVFDQGFLYYFYAIQPFLFVIVSLKVFISKYLKSFGLYRLQLTYIILGLTLAALLGLVSNLILPQLGITDISILRLGIYGMVFVIGFTSYAILKYRLMDIRVIIRRSAVFTVLVLLITALYAVLSYLLSLVFTELIGIQSVIINGIVMAVLVAIGFEPLKKFLSEITDSFLFKAEYKPQEVLGEFADKLSSTLNLNELTQFLVKKTSEVFKCAKSSLYLFNEEHKEYQEVAMWGKPSTAPTKNIDQKLFTKIFSYLNQIGKSKDIIVREEIKKINEQFKNPILDLLIKQLDSREVNLIVPFYVKEELIGILFLGDKKSGDVYSQQDLNVLEIIAGQSAVSIQNAGLFEEQKHFAEHLKKEVDKATKELQIANVQLRKLDKAKSEFISIASHQLRTPLTVIRGYISMIEQGDFGVVSHKVQQPLDRVYKSTMRIIGLVEDLLNISRIESGRLKYDFIKTDLITLVADVYDELKQQAKNKGLQFEFIKPTKEIPQLVLDQGKIREVIMNLIDNSIKYTDSGFVRVKLERDDDHVTFSVSDSGRGLATDEIPLLFQKFSRAKGAQLMHTEGTGLGLYIAKNIIAKHSGKIWVESPGPGKGSTFYIRFRIENKRLEK
ncbi:MAG: ATP-binding protein [Candidatus Parcubacteria bacterium]|nr:ATP-binding protein [Candidatus Parcubacteria bacterium]